MTSTVLILGGTAEARRIAAALAARNDCAVTLSLAGRTREPAPQGVPSRVGGFGGAEGLARHLRDAAVDLLIDATHPYAARISANAAEAAKRAGVPLLALRRPAWKAEPGDRWTVVPDVPAAIAALGLAQRRVFLALGRNELAGFAAAPQHSFLVRSVDAVEPPLDLPDVTYLTARGPFREADEKQLLEAERIDAIVCKNSGGPATYGKIVAARELGIEVLMLARPALPSVPGAEDVEGLLQLAAHRLDAAAAKRGV